MTYRHPVYEVWPVEDGSGWWKVVEVNFDGPRTVDAVLRPYEVARCNGREKAEVLMRMLVDYADMIDVLRRFVR